MIIKELEEQDFAAFGEAFAEYYAELDCEDDPVHLVDEYILPDFKAGLLHIAAAFDGAYMAGFAVYQTDDVINDWNFKEGCGTVREEYVVPNFRRQGVGSALLSFCEERLKKEGAKSLYVLPTEESERFFVGRGYADEGGYCAELDSKVLEKGI